MSLTATTRSTTSLVHCSAGELGVPVHYHDGSLLALLYRVSPVAAARLVPADIVEPLILGRRALAMLIAFEYRDTTVGAYNELAIGIYVRRRGQRASALRAVLDPAREPAAGGWVVNLPVTTELACSAGRELWGYPKYVAGIDTEFGARHSRVVLRGELTVEHEAGIGLRLPGAPMVTFTRAGDRLLRTHITVGHMVRFGGAGSAHITLTGDGPTAETVKTLRLCDCRPVTAFRTDALRSVLPAGEVVASASRAVEKGYPSCDSAAAVG